VAPHIDNPTLENREITPLPGTQPTEPPRSITVMNSSRCCCVYFLAGIPTPRRWCCDDGWDSRSDDVGDVRGPQLVRTGCTELSICRVRRIRIRRFHPCRRRRSNPFRPRDSQGFHDPCDLIAPSEPAMASHRPMHMTHPTHTKVFRVETSRSSPKTRSRTAR